MTMTIENSRRAARRGVVDTVEDVSVRGLKKEFSGHEVLTGIDLDVQQGEFVVLLGPSGCGKTTLLRCLSGLEEAGSGTISIRGKVVDEPLRGVFVPPNKRGIGMVFQSYALWPHMTVRGNVAYGLKLAGLPQQEIRGRVDEALQSLNILERAEQYAGQLSGGQQQRVALARAMASQPDLMLLDEPLSNLDAKLRLKVRLDIRRLHRQSGITAVYVTHDQEEAMALADRIAVMDRGEIRQFASPEEVYNAPANAFVADFMGFENLIRGKVRDAIDGPVFEADADGLTVPVARDAEPRPAILAMRAAHIQIVANDAPPARGTVDIEGTVVTRIYLGSATEVIVDVGAVRLFCRLTEDARLEREGMPERGERVRLRIAMLKTVLLADERLPSETDTTSVTVVR